MVILKPVGRGNWTPVTLTVEGGPAANGVLPTGIGAVSVSPSSFTLDKNDNQQVTVSVNGGTLGPGEYDLTIRATGTNSAGDTVPSSASVQRSSASKPSTRPLPRQTSGW